MSHNTWIHRVARVGIRPLLNTRVTPNQLTTVRLATGIGAAVLFGLGPGPHAYWAGALFLLSMVLDRADGELARIGGKSTPWGHNYDLVSDALCNALVFVAIGVGLRHGALGAATIPMGVMAGAAIACILWLMLRIEGLHGHRSAHFKSAAGFDADDAMLIVPVSAFLGLTEPLLVAAFVGAPLFAMYTYFSRREHLSPSTD
ncbi:MAG: CDP-alcohol phosphatidyltransferase family protein [Gammaproteobacteria bacterium]|nr:CDP-alcohol phosphatidyltransferase family protein [Gammaproteobacteria bacterium]